MLYHIRLVILLLATLLIASNGAKVILISVDGMRNDYLWLAYQQAQGIATNAPPISIPNILSLASMGVMANGSISVMPAMTFPAHTTMITGVRPHIHGIAINCEDTWRTLSLPPQDHCAHRHFYYQINSTTIVDKFIDNHMKVASVDWPVSVGMPGNEIYPGNIGNPDDLEQANWLFSTLIGTTTRTFFPTVQSLFDITDDRRGDLANNYLRNLQPDLLLLHYNDLDGVEHGNGYMSTAALNQLKLIDTSIGELVGTLKELNLFDETYIILTSDHGHMNVSHTIHPQVLFSGLGLIPTAILPYDGSTAGCFPVFLAPGISSAQLSQVDGLLDNIVANPSQYGIEHVYRGDSLQQEGGYPGAYAVLEGFIGWDFDNPLTGDYLNSPDDASQHGWSPERPEMHGVFIAVGPNVAQKKIIDTVRLIDITPTIASMMNFSLNTAEGRVLSELFG